MTAELYKARDAEARWRTLGDKRAIFASRSEDPHPLHDAPEMFPHPSGRIQ
jgi:hypothetical protein